MAIEYVRNQGATNGGGGSSTISLTFSVAIPVGNFLIMGVGCGTTGTTITSVTDTKSNTYQVDRTQNTTTRNGFIVSARVTTALTTSDSVTVNFSASVGSRLISVDEFTGLHASTWLGTGLVASTTGSSTTPNSGAVQVAKNGSMLYGVGIFANAGISYAPGTTHSGAYQYLESNETKIAGGAGLQTEYYIGAGASFLVSATGTITSAPWTQLLAVYQPNTPGFMGFF